MESKRMLRWKFPTLQAPHTSSTWVTGGCELTRMVIAPVAEDALKKFGRLGGFWLGKIHVFMDFMGTCAENGGKSSINGRFAIMFDCQRNRPQAMKPLMEVAENSGFLGVTVRTKEWNHVVSSLAMAGRFGCPLFRYVKIPTFNSSIVVFFWPNVQAKWSWSFKSPYRFGEHPRELLWKNKSAAHVFVVWKSSSRCLTRPVGSFVQEHPRMIHWVCSSSNRRLPCP